MNEIPSESEELGSTIKKNYLNYLDDCNKKFEKKVKITKSKKRDLIENILIKGFSKFVSISKEENIDDECTVRVYFFIHGLRDSIRDDEVLENEWKQEEDIKNQIIDLVLTLSQYDNRNISKLKTDIIKKARKYFPNINIPFKTTVVLRKFFGNRKLINKRG